MRNDDTFKEQYSEYYEDENLPKRKRKKRLGVRIYHFFSTIIGIAIVVLTIALLFHVQEVSVSGNTYTDEQKIIDMVTKDPYSGNSLYVCGKYLLGKGETLKNFTQIKVGLKKPWILKVTVKEKEIAGYIESDGSYLYFDKEGMVVYKDTKLLEGIPKIEGLTLNNLSLYDTLDADDKEIFTQVLKTAEGIKSYGIATERVVYKNDSIYLNQGNIYISLGKKVSEDQLAQIPPILEKLSGEEGTLHLENYSVGSKTITFKRGEFPPE